MGKTIHSRVRDKKKKTNEEEIIIKTVGVEATGRKRGKRKW